MAQTKPSKAKKVAHFFEHLGIGAASYAGLGAIAGSEHKVQVGLSATALMAGFKEGTDAHDGKDSKKDAALHALTILGGAGAVAIFWH